MFLPFWLPPTNSVRLYGSLGKGQEVQELKFLTQTLVGEALVDWGKREK